MASRFVKQALPWAILALGVPLLQYHSIALWFSSITGRPFPGYSWAVLLSPWDGWGWSVLIEAIALWSWIREPQTPASAGWQRRGWIVVAVVATGLLIGAPLLRVSAPLLAQGVTVADTEGETARLQADRASFVDLAKLRTVKGGSAASWQRRIDQVDHELAEWQERREAIREGPASLSGQRKALIAAQLLALVLFQVGVTLAIRHLAGSHATAPDLAMPVEMPSAPDPARIPARPPAPPVNGKEFSDPAILDQRVQALRPIIQARFNGRPVAQVAQELGCDPRDLSLMKYHERHRAAGERVISAAMLQRIEQRLGANGDRC